MRLPTLTVVFAATLAVFATDSPTCNTGVQCCNTVRPAGITDLTQILGLLGLVVPLGIPIALDCTALSAIPIGDTCDAKTVCCKNTASDGSLAVGCVNVVV